MEALWYSTEALKLWLCRIKGVQLKLYGPSKTENSLKNMQTNWGDGLWQFLHLIKSQIVPLYVFWKAFLLCINVCNFCTKSVTSVFKTLTEQGYCQCFSSIGWILGRSSRDKVQALGACSRVSTRGLFIDPLLLRLSEWFLLFTKNQWTGWRECVEPERRERRGAGNASIHLFIFHQNNFGAAVMQKVGKSTIG